MCGIAGAVSTRVAAESICQRVLAMQNALQHRGPDDRGVVAFPGFSASVAHTRLSIIDLSSGGRQPMRSNNQRYTITYNGEIYNYQSLKAELELQGESFSSESDTEVILRLYQREGARCLDKLRGMYALFIWDSKENKGFAARDPLGVKPLYYWADNHTLAFASELRALLAAGFANRDLNSAGLLSYCKTGTCSEPDTLVKGIAMLPAGFSMTWAAGDLQLSEHSRIHFNPVEMDQASAMKKTRSALEDSVKAHFVADVPVGIFLSGGIDSTALLALARQVTDQTINTYSIAFEDPAWNEADVARRVADHFGTEHTELLMTADIASTLFEGFLAAVDQPSIDGFNTYCVAKLAHHHGEKVVLSGLGGDELFAGYKSFELLPKMCRLSRSLSWLAPVFAAYSRHFCWTLPPRARRVLDFLGRPGSAVAAHQSLRGIFSDQEAQALVQQILTNTGSGTQSIATDHLSLVSKEFMNGDLRDQISTIELSTYMRNQLLRDSDVMSMAWGLELRVPFVDYKLIQAISDIPAAIRLHQGKQLLVESVPEIPDWVIKRPKQGFRFPFDKWFSDSWGDLSPNRELTTPIPKWIPLKPWYRRWSMLVLQHWHQQHLSP